jgi:hypothetical protein
MLHNIVQSTLYNTQITRMESDCDPVFIISPMCGTVRPQDETVITVTYTPKANGQHSVDHYQFTTVGGNRFILTVTGTAMGSKVWIQKADSPLASAVQQSQVQQGEQVCAVSDSLNFRDVEVGKSSTTVLNLYNASPVPCRYSINVPTADGAVFKVCYVQVLYYTILYVTYSSTCTHNQLRSTSSYKPILYYDDSVSI